MGLILLKLWGWLTGSVSAVLAVLAAVLGIAFLWARVGRDRAQLKTELAKETVKERTVERDRARAALEHRIGASLALDEVRKEQAKRPKPDPDRRDYFEGGGW